MCFLGLGGRVEALMLESNDSSVAGVSVSSVEESVKEDLEVGLRGAECSSNLGTIAGGVPGGV